MAVRVRTLQVGAKKDIPHKEGMTLTQALTDAKATVPAGGTVIVNGQVVDDLNTPVMDGVVVNVIPPVDNG